MLGNSRGSVFSDGVLKTAIMAKKARGRKTGIRVRIHLNVYYLPHVHSLTVECSVVKLKMGKLKNIYNHRHYCALALPGDRRVNWLKIVISHRGMYVPAFLFEYAQF
jgi:hypothetical protein